MEPLKTVKVVRGFCVFNKLGRLDFMGVQKGTEKVVLAAGQL